MKLENQPPFPSNTAHFFPPDHQFTAFLCSCDRSIWATKVKLNLTLTEWVCGLRPTQSPFWDKCPAQHWLLGDGEDLLPAALSVCVSCHVHISLWLAVERMTKMTSVGTFSYPDSTDIPPELKTFLPKSAHLNHSSQHCIPQDYENFLSMFRQRWLECALLMGAGYMWAAAMVWCTSNGHGTKNSFGSRGKGRFRLQKLLASSSRGFWLTRGSWTSFWWLLQWCSGAGAELCLGWRDLQRLQQGEISMANHNRAYLFMPSINIPLMINE